MKRKLAIIAVLSPLVAFAQSAQAPHIVQDSSEFARVVSSTPIPGPPVARQVCSPTTDSAPPAAHSTGGAILGGLTGALVGSRFGGGHGQDAATVVGAIGGAMLGDRIGAANSSEASTGQSCQTVYESGPPAGYQVTYEYQGQRANVTLDYPPGDYVKVRKVVTVQ